MASRMAENKDFDVPAEHEADFIKNIVPDGMGCVFPKQIAGCGGVKRAFNGEIQG